METKKVPITARALIQRINRRLSHDNKKVHKVHPQARTGNDVPLQHDLGHYYAVDLGRNQIIDTHLDLDGYARDLGVLAGWEVLAT